MPNAHLLSLHFTRPVSSPEPESRGSNDINFQQRSLDLNRVVIVDTEPTTMLRRDNVLPAEPTSATSSSAL